MLELAEKYKRDVDEVHRLFFQVSCDRDRLIRHLEGSSKAKDGSDKWELIEDLAVKDDPRSATYQYILQKKGEKEVQKRR